MLKLVLLCAIGSYPLIQIYVPECRSRSINPNRGIHTIPNRKYVPRIESKVQGFKIHEPANFGEIIINPFYEEK